MDNPVLPNHIMTYGISFRVGWWSKDDIGALDKLGYTYTKTAVDGFHRIKNNSFIIQDKNIITVCVALKKDIKILEKYYKEYIELDLIGTQDIQSNSALANLFITQFNNPEFCSDERSQFSNLWNKLGWIDENDEPYPTGYIVFQKHSLYEKVDKRAKCTIL